MLLGAIVPYAAILEVNVKMIHSPVIVLGVTLLVALVVLRMLIRFVPTIGG